MAATATTDGFDPWTVLGIAPSAGVTEARRAYRKLIAKYHPDVDPSPEAEQQFQKIVRAHAIVTGEDKDMDISTLLKNAVNNLRSDLEFKKQRIADLKAKAIEEEEAMLRMEDQLKEATVKRDEVTQELGVYGGAALGFLAAGPTGLVVGAVLGLTLRDRDDAVGQVLRGTGTVTKGIVDAVGKVIQKKQK